MIFVCVCCKQKKYVKHYVVTFKKNCNQLVFYSMSTRNRIVRFFRSQVVEVLFILEEEQKKKNAKNTINSIIRQSFFSISPSSPQLKFTIVKTNKFLNFSQFDDYNHFRLEKYLEQFLSLFCFVQFTHNAILYYLFLLFYLFFKQWKCVCPGLVGTIKVLYSIKSTSNLLNLQANFVCVFIVKVIRKRINFQVVLMVCLTFKQSVKVFRTFVYYWNFENYRYYL